jgi:hypothetical protein
MIPGYGCLKPTLNELSIRRRNMVINTSPNKLLSSNRVPAILIIFLIVIKNKQTIGINDRTPKLNARSK